MVSVEEIKATYSREAIRKAIEILGGAADEIRTSANIQG